MKHGLPERRSSKRFPTQLDGLIVGDQGQRPIACLVSDLSEVGVRLVVSAPADVPLEFELQIPAQGASASVRLVWTDGVHYGATFTD
ncbi:PilZ domain-containing protein [Microvirga sp. VF16]|uniref:PilZ domain-containing protein n=1 Tax=Microvirga sp. VF16 TaxID=2807101 RepID=UPI00193E95B4|nr:PilZ domain-containing protein [Microvirga sp. VF16]QRM35583.1 PilZ domain-containing protein [Microvirga sp. VF16]